jgi:hypothetical protein
VSRREYIKLVRNQNGTFLYLMPLSKLFISFARDSNGDLLIVWDDRRVKDGPLKVWVLELSKIWKRNRNK